MIEFRTEHVRLSVSDIKYRGYRTTYQYDPDEDGLELYKYLIQCEDNGKLYEIEFISETKYGNVVLQWWNHQLSQEKIKSLDLPTYTKLDALTSQIEENMLKNCYRLKDLVQQDTFFGINALILDFPGDERSGHIQILNYKEYERGQLIYHKGGVISYNEQPMKISEYRNLIEWNPVQMTVRLINLGIKQGQEYAGKSRVVFELSYNNENSYLKYVNPEWEPNKKTISKWMEYIRCIINDPDVLNGVKLQIIAV
ncbi:hypothetical protein [Paenibacillus agri]|uniref:Uncharacterized protein n=1 Tax=Paenibacillus agri TaxID=2744309 RepID=A0A850EMX2_9BACL|nr:hypothetical protein [Paenibacillus agri]NUU61120.1 hypothetical protein [Paenibacillus agri]